MPSIFFCLLFSACATLNARKSSDDLTNLSLVDDPNDVQTFSIDEVKKYGAGKQLIWAPFVLPTKDTTIRENHFLLGAVHQDGTIVPAKDGECFFWNESKEGTTKFYSEKTLSIKNFGKNQAGSLFLFKRNLSKETIGGGVFDNNGEARCKIRSDADIIVTGFGNNILETPIHHILNEKLEVEVPPHSLVNVKPSPINRVELGDTIRIAKFSNKGGVSGIQELSDLDLFRPTYSVEHNFGAEEYLSTSIFVGSRPFQISLQNGSYLFAVMRAGKLKCLRPLDLSQESDVNLSCTEEKRAEKKEQMGNGGLIDFTPIPRRLLKSKAFFSWWQVQPQKTLYVLDEPTEPKDDSVKPLQNRHYLEYGTAEKSFYPTGFSYQVAPALKDKKSQYTDVVTSAVSMSHNLLKSKSIEEIVRTYAGEKIDLIAGTGLHAFTEGSPLFSAFVYHPYGFTDRERSGNLFKLGTSLTNGALIKILQPSLRDNSQIVSIKTGGRMRFELELPAGNETEVFEIYHDGKVNARYVAFKSNLNQKETLTFDHKITEEKDFWLTLVAKGDVYLPEFLYSQKWQQPYAIMLPFCVDVNEDRNCETPYGSR